MCKHECECPYPDISKGKPEEFSLNQVIKCHGDQPLSEIFKCQHRNNK